MSTKPKHVTAADGYRALQVKLHSREKLHYIARYIDQFCTATRHKWPNRCYIDLFSGPGINVFDTTHEEIFSSSLSACSHKHPFTHYFLNDIEKESVSALQARITASKLESLAKVYLRTKDCNLVVDEFVEMIPTKSVNLAILDGFGTECHWSTVQKLTTVARIDLVILFPGNMSVVRNAERWSQEDFAMLDKFMPSKEWRNIWTNKRISGSGATAELLNLYVNGIKGLGYQNEGLVRTQLIKSETGQPLYHLIYASRHPLGGKFWQQATGKDDEGQISLPF